MKMSELCNGAAAMLQAIAHECTVAGDPDVSALTYDKNAAFCSVQVLLDVQKAIIDAALRAK